MSDIRDKNQAALFDKLSVIEQSNLRKSWPRRETAQRLDISYNSSFVDIISKAQVFAAEWNKTLEDVILEHNYTENYGYFSSEVHLEVRGLETDIQYHSRLWEMHDASRIREEHDRKEFERLSAKFSKK